MILPTKLLHGCILVSLLHITVARIGFKKDTSIDKIEFPPRTLQTFHSGVPTGHLRPLGELQITNCIYIYIISSDMLYIYMNRNKSVSLKKKSAIQDNLLLFFSFFLAFVLFLFTYSFFKQDYKWIDPYSKPTLVMIWCHHILWIFFLSCETIWFEGSIVFVILIKSWRNCINLEHINSSSASRDNWCTVGGDGGCRVSEVQAGTTSPMPDHKGFKLQ